MNYITVKDLANELGMDRSHCHRFVRKLGIETCPVRPPGTRGSPLNAISLEDAENVKKERERQGYSVANKDPRVPRWNKNGGQFYLVALDPEMRPERLKFGYAQDVQRRLSVHRTSAPEAKLLASWPAKETWERCVIDALTVGCEQVSPEIYDCTDVDAVIEKGDRMFDLLPSQETQ